MRGCSTQRRGRDLNPRRTFQPIRDFQSRSLDRSDTSPRCNSVAGSALRAKSGKCVEVSREDPDLPGRRRRAQELTVACIAMPIDERAQPLGLEVDVQLISCSIRLLRRVSMESRHEAQHLGMGLDPGAARRFASTRARATKASHTSIAARVFGSRTSRLWSQRSTTSRVVSRRIGTAATRCATSSIDEPHREGQQFRLSREDVPKGSS